MQQEVVIKSVKLIAARDLRDHKITLRYARGLYRHWRCQRLGSSVYYFDIVTWPGYLAFVGDMGDFVFARERDMVPFVFRACSDPHYLAQKCVAHSESLMDWSEEVFSEHLAKVAAEHPEEQEKLTEIRSAYEEYQSVHDAERAMHESGLWDELPSCRVFSFRYLWCLNAIEWFCANLRDQAQPGIFSRLLRSITSFGKAKNEAFT